jgi:hypothetical protein
VLVRSLCGLEVDTSQGNPFAPEWVDLGMQFVSFAGARAQPPHAPAEGNEETAQHLAREGLPILTHLEHPPVDGGVIQPIIQPTPVYAWSVVYPVGNPTKGVDALLEAATQLGAAGDWLKLPDPFWLPEPESSSASVAELR